MEWQAASGVTLASPTQPASEKSPGAQTCGGSVGDLLCRVVRLLDRYLLRELAVPLLYCLGGFLIFWVSFDLISDIDEFQKEALTVADIGQYYLYRIPDLLVIILPVGLLLALLYSLTNHARHNEIIAMRAAGQSLLRISAPYIIVGIAASLCLFYLNERFVPDGQDKAAQVRKRRLPDAAAQREWRNNVNFRNARDKRIWNIGAYNQRTTEMRAPRIETALPDGKVNLVIAESGWHTNGGWFLKNVEVFTYNPREQFENTGIPWRTNAILVPKLTEKPEDINLQIRFNSLNAYDASKKSHLSLAEIKYLRDHLELNKRDRALLETQRQSRLAQPWTCLVVVLIALPFGTLSGRKNVFVGAASSIFICFGYFFLSRFGLALGTGGYIPPAVAAWSPNFVFGAIALWMTRKVI
jgi:lipopolysaccharide export system permease protein